MKKFVCFWLFCFSFLFFAFYGWNKKLPNEFVGCDLQIFCSTSQQPNCEYQNIKNGEGCVYFSKYSEQTSLLNNLNGVEGITYVISGNYIDYCNLQNKLGINCIEKTNDSCVGFCDYFGMSTFYNGKKVNVQMSFSQGKIYIGTPLILGCY